MPGCQECQAGAREGRGTDELVALWQRGLAQGIAGARAVRFCVLPQL